MDDQEKILIFENFIFDGYQVFGNYGHEFAVPFDSDPEFIKRLLAAGNSFGLFSSIDYVYKKYIEDLNLLNEYDKKTLLINKAISLSKLITSEVANKRKTLSNLPDHFGLLASGAGLLKLEATFAVARFLVFHGLIFEASSIIRLILEQIAWCYEVRYINSKELYKCMPTESISTLKKLIPEVGRAYGKLSKRAHVDTSQINRVVDFSKEQTQVVYANNHEILLEVFFLLNISDWYGIVMELNNVEFFNKFEFIKKQDGKYIINPKRISKQKINKLINEIRSEIEKKV